MVRARVLMTVLSVGAAATLAACGGAVPEASPEKAPPVAATPPAETAEPSPDTGGFSETTETAIATTVDEPEPEAGPELRPPPIVLVSKAGRQEAVQGSYCITGVTESGQGAGVCADSPFPHPGELSVVRPGDAITITLAGADIVVAADCSQAQTCPIVTIHPLGCGPDRAVAEFALERNSTRWTVELEPGAYELMAFVYFDDGSGISGDSGGGLGLLVDPDRERVIIPVDETLAACPYPERP